MRPYSIDPVYLVTIKIGGVRAHNCCILKNPFQRYFLLSPNLLNFAVIVENRASDQSLLVKWSTWENQSDGALCFKYRGKALVPRLEQLSSTHILIYSNSVKSPGKLFIYQMKITNLALSLWKEHYNISYRVQLPENHRCYHV